MNQEQWKEIVGLPGFYVSNFGRVRSPRGVYSPFRLNTGYLQIKIRRKAYAVHRLVAGAFCAGWFDGAVVNHKNGSRDDNRAENLEWVSHSYNLRHAYSHLGKEVWSKGRFSKDHNSSKAVVSRCMKTGVEKLYWCGLDAVREGGFDSSAISRCCNGIWKHHKGFQWRFASTEDVRREQRSGS